MSINKINGAVSDTLSKVNGTRNTLLSNMLVPSNLAIAPMFNSHSIDLDGSADYIDLNTVVGDIDTDAGAVTLWFKIDTNNTCQLWKTNQGSSAAQNQIQIYYNSANGKIVFQQKYNGVSVTWNSTAITSGDGNWHFIAMSWSDLDFIAYLDTEASGVQTLDQSGTTPTPFNPGACTAGRNSAASNLYLDGHLNEIGMWDAELSADAIVAIYNSGKGINLTRDVGNYTNASDLIGYWKMEENTGNTVVDSSGGGETGALNATDLWSTDTI